MVPEDRIKVYFSLLPEMMGCWLFAPWTKEAFPSQSLSQKTMILSQLQQMSRVTRCKSNSVKTLHVHLGSRILTASESEKWKGLKRREKRWNIDFYKSDLIGLRRGQLYCKTIFFPFQYVSSRGTKASLKRLVLYFLNTKRPDNPPGLSGPMLYL